METATEWAILDVDNFPLERDIWSKEDAEGILTRYIDSSDLHVGPMPIRYCASCNEPEGSEYAKHCCTLDNMLED